ncbi:MAG: hypothetical protein JST19_19195 [Bacteroidetes bacterium]|nr:hypothetical protein [Bacteroidota bacterium]
MKKCLLILSAVLSLMNCRKAGPSPDWDEFDSSHIDRRLSQKGPVGNYRLIFLQNEKGYYTRLRVVTFAASKGWKLRSIQKIDSAEVSLAYEMFKGVMNVKIDTFPAWLRSNNSTYYAFYATLQAKDGHMDQLSNEAIVSADESSMCAYNVTLEWAAKRSDK